MRVREESSWANRPMWQKRLHGFASYIMAALAALVWPRRKWAESTGLHIRTVEKIANYETWRHV